MRFVSVVSVVALVSVVLLFSLVNQKRSFSGNTSSSRNGLLIIHQIYNAHRSLAASILRIEADVKAKKLVFPKN